MCGQFKCGEQIQGDLSKDYGNSLRIGSKSLTQDSFSGNRREILDRLNLRDLRRNWLYESYLRRESFGYVDFKVLVGFQVYQVVGKLSLEVRIRLELKCIFYFVFFVSDNLVK